MIRDLTKQASLNWAVSEGNGKTRVDFDLICSCGSRYCFIDLASASLFKTAGGKCLHCGGTWNIGQHQKSITKKICDTQHKNEKGETKCQQ